MQLALPFQKFHSTRRSFDNRAMSTDDTGEKYTRTRFVKTPRASKIASLESQFKESEAAEATPSGRRNASAGGRTEFLFGESAADLGAPRASAADDTKKLRNKALRLLTTREHSREELLQKLARAKARVAYRNAEEKSRESAQQQKDTIEALVNDLAAQGWQSDDRYAEAIVRRLAGQASKRFIAEKLAQAGIKKDAAQLAIEAIEVDDADAARALWQRRFGDAPRDERERQRQVRFLLARGFHLGEAFRIVPNASSKYSSGDEE